MYTHSYRYVRISIKTHSQNYKYDLSVLVPDACGKDREMTVHNKRGGGILMAFKKDIVSRRRSDLEPDCEIMVCDMRLFYVTDLRRLIMICFVLQYVTLYKMSIMNMIMCAF